MTTSPQLPMRPVPSRGLGEFIRVWLEWFGPARLVLSALSVAVVVAGSVWLLRAPAPPTEAGLPIATTAPPVVSYPSSVAPWPTATAAPPVASSPATTIVVHVAGAVVAPGVYAVGAEARAGEAVAAAGGPAPDADTDAVNLAAPLVDGQRVYVPRVGEVDPGSLVTPSGGAGDVTASTVSAGPVDLNRATAAELEQLPGVGPATAAAIVDDRNRNGPFATVDDLDRVSGIGDAKIERLRALVTV